MREELVCIKQLSPEPNDCELTRKQEVPRIQEEQRRLGQKEQEVERVMTIEAQEKGPKTQHVREETEKFASRNTEESGKLQAHEPQSAITPIKWICTVCNRTMPTFSRDSHLAGIKHQKIQRRKQDEEERRTKLAQTRPSIHGKHTWDCGVCQKTMSVKLKESHLKGRKHQAELQQEQEQSSPAENKPSGANARDNRADKETSSKIAGESNLAQEIQTGIPPTVQSGSYYKNTWDWEIYSRPTSTTEGQSSIIREFTCNICSRTMPLGSRELHCRRHNYWARKVRAAG